MKMTLIKVNASKMTLKHENDTCKDEIVQNATIGETHQNRSIIPNKVGDY